MENQTRQDGQGSTESDDSAISSTQSGSERSRNMNPVDQVAALIRGQNPTEGEERAEGADRNRSQDAPDRALDGGETYSEGGDTEEAEERPQRRSAPRTLQEAAEALEMTPEALYALEIGLGDGSKVSLGKMKDAFAELGETRRESARREGSLDERESAIRDQESQVQELMDYLGRGFTPKARAEVGAALQRMRGEKAVAEAQALMRALPEMKDEKFRDRFEGFLATEAIKRFKYRPDELVDNRDHRLFMVLADNMRMRERLRFLTQATPDPKDAPKAITPQGRGGGGADGAYRKAKRTGKQSDAIRAVSNLIGGGRG